MSETKRLIVDIHFDNSHFDNFKENLFDLLEQSTFYYKEYTIYED